MSNIYIQEPQTHGKILLETTVGDIDIELWAHETPKACRNFVQLCLEGYYENTIFHRVVKGFIAQGGDPTGTGTGGESIYGAPFKDEFHTRLRFVRRGLVAMANAGKDDNSSQFFFTFAPSPELQNKHTIFGKVAGNTIYNMMKLEDCLVNKDDRPEYAPKILKATVLNNPFPDIIPRVLKKESTTVEEKKAIVSKSRATKDFKLLSFGEEAEEDENMINEASKEFRGKSKSIHDLTDDPRLSSMTVIEAEEKGEQQESDDDNDDDDDSEETDDDTVAEKIRKKLKTSKKPTEENPEPAKRREDDDDEKLSKTVKNKKINKVVKRRKDEDEDDDDGDDDDSDYDEKMLKSVMSKKQKREESSKQNVEGDKSLPNQSDKIIAKRQAAVHENKTLGMLARFQMKLQKAKEQASDTADEDKGQEKEDEAPDDLLKAQKASENWLIHRLEFDTHEMKVKDANMKDEDTYEIFDPRNPINQRRREASKQAMRSKR